MPTLRIVYLRVIRPEVTDLSYLYKRLDSLSEHPILKDTLLALTLLPFKYPFLLLHASSPTNCLTPAFISVTDSPILSFLAELVLVPISRPTFILRLSPERAKKEEQGVVRVAPSREKVHKSASCHNHLFLLEFYGTLPSTSSGRK
ncbi:hypothetical protein Tco_1450008 [Tanacetum coccineum]